MTRRLKTASHESVLTLSLVELPRNAELSGHGLAFVIKTQLAAVALRRLRRRPRGAARAAVACT